MKDKLVLDLETQNSFEEVGGRENCGLLKVSVVGIYSYLKDSFEIFLEDELEKLVTVLKDAELIVGFNLKRFDYVVLEPYLGNFIYQLPTLDILEVVENTLGHRLKLDSLAQCTLGIGKSGNGLDAIKYFRSGEIEKLKKYCLDDVRITRDLYEYGKKNNHLLYEKSFRLTPIPVKW
jgi:DEAD/DEAH box helicase domain-containing protein